jgi:hypothetical protein
MFPAALPKARVAVLIWKVVVPPQGLHSVAGEYVLVTVAGPVDVIVVDPVAPAPVKK